MALHDVDRGHADRSHPMPNAGDVVFQRMSHGIVSANYQTPLTNPNTTQGLQSGYFQLVQQTTIGLEADGSNQSFAQNAHNLGYIPWALAMLPGATVSGTPGGTIHNASVVLPNYINASISGGVVQFNSYLTYFVDNEKIYFNLLNGTGDAINLVITYYLYRQVASV